MRSACLIFVTCACALATACGGKALSSDDTTDDAGSFGREPDGGGDGSNGFVDPQCPEAGPPETVAQCDVFKQDCPDPGEGCYPASIPPSQPCESEIYGSFCMSPGTGTQGAPCDSAGCAPGFVCLITGATTACARLCDLGGGQNGCSDGYVCEPIDVPGFSACL